MRNNNGFEQEQRCIVQVPAARLLRSILLIPLYMFAMADGIKRPDDIQAAWNTALKVLICIAMFFAAQLVKTVAAKLVARSFYKRAHFDKMQDALNKVRPTPHMWNSQ